MQKRCKTMLTRNSQRSAVWAKSLRIGILIMPAFLAISLLSWQARQPGSWMTADGSKKLGRKDLVKIYSIVKSHRPDIRDREVWEISETILKESSGYGIDPMLVLALIDVESKFQYAAVSPAGARGIMQILPYVGKALVEEIGLERESDLSPFRPEFLDDPILNIKLGIYYLHDLKKSFHNLQVAITAYNFGPTRIRYRLQNELAYPESYATAVLTAYQKYKDATQPTF